MESGLHEWKGTEALQRWRLAGRRKEKKTKGPLLTEETGDPKNLRGKKPRTQN